MEAKKLTNSDNSSILLNTRTKKPQSNLTASDKKETSHSNCNLSKSSCSSTIRILSAPSTERDSNFVTS